MANNASPIYGVNTPPYYVDLNYGSLANIMDRTFRFCSWEPMAEVDLPCGVFVTMTTNAVNTNFVKLLSSDVDKIFGVTYFNMQRLLKWDDTLKAYVYPANEIVTLAQEGDLIMHGEVAVNPGDPVYTRHTAGAGALTRIGALSNAAGSGLVLVPGAKFVNKTTQAGKVIVSLPDII